MTAIVAAATPVDALYGRLLATAAGGAPTRARVRLADGRLEPLPLDRWLAPADAADEAVLARVRAPILDIGCGPGRHLAALAAAGRRGLGVDLSPVAVALAIGRGAEAIPGSVFADVPRAGTWRTALLLDGNIGIGGAPSALLRRAGELLAPDGRAIVEVDPPGARSYRTRIRIETPDAVSEWFAWARVGADGIAAVARRAGFVTADRLVAGGRTFVTLERR
jgi:SAM-dependent methyltransferase